jgi:hypothetical protein
MREVNKKKTDIALIKKMNSSKDNPGGDLVLETIIMKRLNTLWA